MLLNILNIIYLWLDDLSLLNLSVTCLEFYNWIKNPIIWQQKFIDKFGKVDHQISNWRKFYLAIDNMVNQQNSKDQSIIHYNRILLEFIQNCSRIRPGEWIFSLSYPSYRNILFTQSLEVIEYTHQHFSFPLLEDYFNIVDHNRLDVLDFLETKQLISQNLGIDVSYRNEINTKHLLFYRSLETKNWKFIIWLVTHNYVDRIHSTIMEKIYSSGNMELISTLINNDFYPDNILIESIIKTDSNCRLTPDQRLEILELLESKNKLNRYFEMLCEYQWFDLVANLADRKICANSFRYNSIVTLIPNQLDLLNFILSRVDRQIDFKFEAGKLMDYAIELKDISTIKFLLQWRINPTKNLINKLIQTSKIETITLLKESGYQFKIKHAPRKLRHIL